MTWCSVKAQTNFNFTFNPSLSPNFKNVQAKAHVIRNEATAFGRGLTVTIIPGQPDVGLSTHPLSCSNRAHERHTEIAY